MGNSYHSQSGKRVVIPDNPLDTGGEAEVYAVSASTVAKIYLERSKKKSEDELDLLKGRMAEKLRAMVDNPPPTDDDDGNRVLVWPNDILYCENQRLAGFTMPRIPTEEFDPIFKYWLPGPLKQTLKKHGEVKTPPQIDELLETIGFNFVRIVSSLHELEYIIGDINEKNILVRPNGNIVILDSDSFQVIDKRNRDVFRCPVGREEYADRNLLVELRSGGNCDVPIRHRKFCVNQSRPHPKDFGCVDRKVGHDSFAIAVVLFRLFMGGVHPFDGGEGGYRDNIIYRRFYCNEVLSRPDLNDTLQQRELRWSQINEPWKRYFEETFTHDRRDSASEVLDLIGCDPPLTYRNTSSQRSLGKQRSVSSGASHSESTSPVPPNANQGTGSLPNQQQPGTGLPARTESGSSQQNVQGGQKPSQSNTQVANRFAKAASGQSNKKRCHSCHKNDRGQYRCSNCQADLLPFKTCTNPKCDNRMNEELPFCSKCGTAN